MLRTTLAYLISASLFCSNLVGAAEPPVPAQPASKLSEQLAMAKAYLEVVGAAEDGTPGETLTLDTFSLLNQKVHPLLKTYKDGESEKLVSLIPWPKVIVRLVSTEGDTQILPMAGRSSKKAICGARDVCSLELWTNSGGNQPDRRLNDFLLRVTSVTVLGPYITFVTSDHFKPESEEATLSVIDLKSYQPALGNSRIPVFKIPLKSNQPIKSLEVTGNKLVIDGGSSVSRDQLEQITQLFKASFNLTANMMNPRTMAGAETMYSGVDTFLARELEKVGREQSADSASPVDTDRVGAAVTQQMEIVQKQLAAEEQRKEIFPQAGLTSALSYLDKRKEFLNEEGKRAVAAYAKSLATSGEFRQALNATQEDFRRGRKILPRLRLWESYLTKPAVNGGENIARGIGELATYWLRGAGDVGSLFVYGMSTGVTKRSVVFMTSLLAAWGLSGYMPDSYYQVIAGALEAGQITSGYAGHVLYGLAESAQTSAQSIVSAVNPATQWNAYIDPSQGNWYKSITGVTIFMGYLAAGLGAWHVVFRVRDLVRDMRKPEYQGLVKRQQAIERAFAEDVAKGEAKRQAALASLQQSLSPEEEAQIMAEFRQVRDQRIQEDAEKKARRKNWVRGLFEAPLRWIKGSSPRPVSEALSDELSDGLPAMSGVARATTVAGQIADEVALETSQLAALEPKPDSGEEFQKIKTRFQAFMHLLKSTASYRYTVGEYTTGFNFYASIRYSMLGWFGIPLIGREIERQTGQMVPMMVLPRPLALASRMFYPNFFSTAVTSREGKVTMPTALNGGTNSLLTEMQMDSLLSDASPDQIKEDLNQVEAFEDQMLEVETTLWHEAAKSAFNALAGYIEKDSELVRLFTSGEGFTSVTAGDIRKLHFRNKLFVRTYLDLVYTEVMASLLRDSIAKQQGAALDGILAKAARDVGNDPTAVADLTKLAYEEDQEDANEPVGFTTTADLLDLKKTIVAASQGGQPLQLNFTKEEIEAKVKEVSARPDILEKAKSEAGRLIPNWESWRRHFKYEIASNYDPEQNGSMRRYDIVYRMKQDPVAMARATRNEISSLFRTLPVDIAMKFLLLAGVTQGIAKPIQEYMFGPNSVGYLSQYEFYGGLLTGILFNSVSSAWGKLQQDYDDSSAGLFGNIPQNEDAKKGFWQLFFKNWKSRENSFWKYYKQYGKIVFWNFPAALPQMLLLNLLFLGRIDLEGFIFAYLSIYLLPLDILKYKADQIFEQTSFWAARGLRQDALQMSDVQLWLNDQMQSLRNNFNLRRDLLTNPLTAILENTFLTGTITEGPFAFWRYVTGGFAPTELVVYKLRALKDAAAETSLSQAVSSATSLCEKLLTKGNTGLIKLPK